MISSMSLPNKKIKICFVATYTYALFHHHNNSLPITGLDVQLYNWAIAFAKDSNYEVHFVVGDFGQPKIETVDRITLWKSSKPKRSGLLEGLLNFISLSGILKKIKADFYIDRGASGPITFEIGVFSKIFRKKFIHMVASDNDINGEYRNKDGIFEAVLHSLALRMADRVTFQNSFQGSTLNKRGIKAFKIQNSFPFSDRRGGDDRKYVLWVGSSYALKRPEIFLELARCFPNERFVLVLQKHDENIFSTIRRKATSLDNLLFVPGVPFHKVDRFFQDAKVFVNSSVYEGFPNTFVQAAIHGVPVVSLNVDPDGIFERERIGVVCHDNMDMLKTELLVLLENKERWREFSNNARSFALQKFDISKNIEEFKKMFAEISC